jgi:hypothetical protein
MALPTWPHKLQSRQYPPSIRRSRSDRRYQNAAQGRCQFSKSQVRRLPVREGVPSPSTRAHYNPGSIQRW